MINTDRNIGILSEKEQEVIRSAEIAVLGVGMGSNIAELLVRTGFTHLTVVDGDTVAETNLNRQLYCQEDIGKMKTVALGGRLKAINPDLDLRVFSEFLTKDFQMLEGVDVIIDTIDLSSVETIIELHNWARNHNIPIVFPFNLGWTSIATVFSSGSCTIERMLGIGEGELEKAKVKDYSFWAKFLSKYVPEYGKKQFEDFISHASSMKDWCPAPQIGATVNITASLVTTLTVNLLLGKPAIVAPDVVRIDLIQSVSGLK